jgi:hypothetical protein
MSYKAVFGLNFDEAREKVLQSLQLALRKANKTISIMKRSNKTMVFFAIPTAVIVTVLFITTLFGVTKQIFWSLITCNITLCVSLGLNLWCLREAKATISYEIVKEVNKVYEDYNEFYQVQNESSHPSTTLSSKIYAGHPHISIITCFRNQEWQRIPSLLLAEGKQYSFTSSSIFKAVIKSRVL